MTGHDGSIYRTCRESAGMTQEQAAEQLNCSVRALARYETGEQRTPDDMAYHMAVLYDSQYLAVQHLRLVSQVAAELLPAVAVRELPVAAIRIINRMRAFAEQHREQDLLNIAEDGVISSVERPLFDEIMGELREMVQAILELGIVQPEPKRKKRGRPAAGTAKRSEFRTCTENDCKRTVSPAQQTDSRMGQGRDRIESWGRCLHD